MTDVSYPVVRAHVAERKPQVRAEAGRGPAEVFVRQAHRPGDEAEVDFGEIVVRLAGEDVSASCSACGCRSPARPSTACRCRAGRRRSSRATSTRSASWAGCRPGRSAMTPQVRGHAGDRVPPVPGGDRPVDRVPLPLRTGRLLPPARHRRPREKGRWRGRSAGSAATTGSPSRTCRRCPSFYRPVRRTGGAGLTPAHGSQRSWRTVSHLHSNHSASAPHGARNPPSTPSRSPSTADSPPVNGVGKLDLAHFP
jgi:hypothetical protein